MKQEIFAERAKYLTEILKLSKATFKELNDLIDDEIETSDEYDNHPLSKVARSSLQAIRKIESFINLELINDKENILLNEFEKIASIEALSSKDITLKHILKTKKTK